MNELALTGPNPADKAKALVLIWDSTPAPRPTQAAPVTPQPVKARSEGEGHVYVLEFSSGRLKVGFTTTPKTRLAHHAGTAKAYGATITRKWVSVLHEEAKPNEKRLLKFCRSLPGVEGEGEYFAGISFDDVTAFADSGLTMTPAEPGPTDSERKKANAREERQRILDNFETRTDFLRRRVHAELRAAGVQVELVGAHRWLMDPKITRVLARLHDAEDVDPQEIRDAFGIGVDA